MNIKEVIIPIYPEEHVVDIRFTYRLVQEEYDRNVFVTTDKNGEIIGLNYYQGEEIGDETPYIKPCPFITEIFSRLNDAKYRTAEENINRAIELYNEAFIFQQNQT